MIGDAVLAALRGEHFAVDWVRDGELADTTLRNENYDLVLLDLGLPRCDGIEVLRRMRARKDATPVLIVTARDALEQRVAGLNAGADDYVLKPYDLNELLARIRALIRRSQGQADSVREIHGLRLNPITREATRLAGDGHDASAIVLSAREWAVLEILMARPGVVYSRTQIEDKLYGWKDEISSNAVEVFIHGLRKKLGSAVIETVRGLGYMMPAE